MYGQVKNDDYASKAQACDSQPNTCNSAASGGMHARLNGHVTLTMSAEDAKVLLAQARQGAKVVAALSDYPRQEFHVLQRLVRALEAC